MRTLLQDLRYALRQLLKAPGFTLTAVATLALGIGATTAIFTLVYDVLLRPLPYAQADRLVVMEEQVAEFRDMYPKLPMNANHFMTWQRESRTIESMALMQEDSMPMGIGTHPQQVDVMMATSGIFPVLRVTPKLGRAFTTQESESGHQFVAILMDSLWRQQFRADPKVVGRKVTLNGYPYTIIGVMPSSFHLPAAQTIAGADMHRAGPVEALVPLALSEDRLSEVNGDFDYFGLARLKAGVSGSETSAEINALQQRIADNLPADAKSHLAAVITPFQAVLVGNNRTPLLILLYAVAGLLLVGCANIANLLLSRAVGRRQQVAIAAALGASRLEMLRMSLRETAVLAAAGGALGILLASALVPVMQQFLPAELNFRGSLHLDLAGAGCALMLSVAATLVAGAAPAWFASRTAPQEVLHSESRLASESRSSKRLRRALVAIEVAVSVALVLMTGLLTTSLTRMMKTNRGFDAERTLAVELDLPQNQYEYQKSRIPFYTQMLERLQALPGVDHAAIVSQIPLAGDQWIDGARIDGDARPAMQVPMEHFRWISPDYFRAIHLPLVRGRFLTASDQGKNYALVSDLTAKALWPGKDAIGKQFHRAGMSEGPPFTVIGVVGDARTISLAKPDPMMVYMPYWYRSDASAGLIVNTRQDPAQMADAIRKAIWSLNPEVSIPNVRSLGGIVEDSIANRRFEMNLLLLFAVSALLLASLGVYGVATYSVVQRQKEIGLRLALGAQKGNIYRLVLRDGLMPVVAGVIAGAAIAMGGAHLLRSMLYEVSPYNPVLAGSAIGVLVGAGVAACLLPAKRAAEVDPMQALKAE
ncbi:ABC transporter permease [Silvibacterium acidisoli]|uniref:ABC transporter permease n=1 Tax=Acidobacteriaceae bacterium ZG23-2 TaxID=2883246 RepID=UPI00406CDA11